MDLLAEDSENRACMQRRPDQPWPTADGMAIIGPTPGKSVPAQTVDATPSNQLIRQHFPMENCFVRLYLNQTLARMVFRLSQRSRTTLSY